MHLVPREVSEGASQPLATVNHANHRQQLDKLVISQLGFLAQRRLARGLKLNHSEATVSRGQGRFLLGG